MKDILIVGETFWDEFENGALRMGGSALNIAWHLQGLGLSPYFISRVGDDKLGHQMIGAMKNWRMTADFLQVDQDHATGVVKVILDANGNADYISPESAALDFIEYEKRFDLLDIDSILYHGTFILRNEVSRNTVRQLKDKGHQVFMDLNLRDPYWSDSLIEEWTRDLHTLKLNDIEIKLLTKKKDLSHCHEVEWIQEWMSTRNIQNVLFTLHEKGSFWIQKGEVKFEPGKKVVVTNTVGAGDAFLAGMLYSNVHDLTMDVVMRASAAFASEICKIPGATSHDHEFYQDCRKSIWKI